MTTIHLDWNVDDDLLEFEPLNIPFSSSAWEFTIAQHTYEATYDSMMDCFLSLLMLDVPYT